MLEGFTKYWGFYFVAAKDANGVGVRDLQDALDDMAEYLDWRSDLERVDRGAQTDQEKHNSRIASKNIRKVLAVTACIVVFKLFLQLAVQVDGTLQEKHKRIWLLFQLSDQVVPLRGGLHPFVRIFRTCLTNASNDALEALVGRLDDIRRDTLPDSPFILGLDEAQHASRLYPRCFMSSTKPNEFRSIIREIAKVFAKLSIKLVVSGTGLSLAELEVAMSSGVEKPPAVELFLELGMFDTSPKLKSFLEVYIPPSIFESDSGNRLQKRMQEYLQGR